jgi:hypothetical protein
MHSLTPGEQQRFDEINRKLELLDKQVDRLKFVCLMLGIFVALIVWKLAS